MRSPSCVTLLAAVAVASLSATASAANKLVAVLPLDVSNSEGKLTKAGAASLEDMLRDVATNTLSGGGWTIMTGDTTLQVLQDNGIDPTKCAEAECHLTLAREISVDKFISGAVQWADDELVASIRLVDTKTGRIMSAEMLEGGSAKSLRAQFEAKATAFFTRGGLLAAIATPAPAAAVTPAPAPATAPPAVTASPAAAQQPTPTAALAAPPAPPPSGTAADQTALWGATPGTARFDAKSALKFVWIPAGAFRFGCEPGSSAGCPSYRAATSVQGFWLGRTEVTVAAYDRCVRSGGCSDVMRPFARCNRPGAPRQPANCVTYGQAEAFCRWAGGRLPTATEWEYAAKNGGNSWFPWGNAAAGPARANYCDRNCADVLQPMELRRWRKEAWIDQATDDGFAGTSPVGNYPAGATGWGLLDMAGNVWEWVDANMSGQKAEARGGSFQQPPGQLSNWLLSVFDKSSTQISIGFRCRL